MPKQIFLPAVLTPPATGVTLMVDCCPIVEGVTTLNPAMEDMLAADTSFGVPAAESVAMPDTCVAPSGIEATP